MKTVRSPLALFSRAAHPTAALILCGVRCSPMVRPVCGRPRINFVVAYGLRLWSSTGCNEGVGLWPLPTILVKAGLKAIKRQRALIQGHPKRSSLSSNFKKVCCSQGLVEGTICKCNCNSLALCQCLGINRLGACCQTNRIGLAAFQLPFRRVKCKQQPILIPYEDNSETRCRTSHGAVFKLVSLIGRGDTPGAHDDSLTFGLLSKCGRDQKRQTCDYSNRSHCLTRGKELIYLANVNSSAQVR